MTSKQQLLDILQNEQSPLANRLQIASRVFTVVELNSLKNKEITLQWLQNLLSNEENQDDVHSTLKNCITNASDVWLHPHLSDSIISILTKSHCRRNSMECCLELMKSVHFSRYFVHNLQKMADVVVFVVNSITGSSLETELINEIHRTVVDCILNVKNNALYNHDLKILFFNHLIKCLAVIAANNGSLVPAIKNCFYQVLFTDSEFRNAFTKYIAGDRDPSDRNQYVVDITDKLRSYPDRLTDELLSLSYSLLMSGYLMSNSNNNSKFKVFVALNQFVNISPYPFGTRTSKEIVLDSKSISVATGLIEKIIEHDLPLDSNVATFTLADWLNVLVDEVLDNVDDSVDVPTLRLLKCILNCNPHAIEYCIKKFAENVMMVKKSDPAVISLYSDLCIDVLNVYIKLSRMHKLISALLVTMNENLDDFDESSVPDKFDILPQQIFIKIQSAITNLPSTVQNVALLNTLLYHLEKDCIAKLKSDKSKRVDPRLALLFDVVTYLISRFISGTRIVDHSVPDLVQSKFEELMNNLSALLNEFGKALISKEHDAKLMESYLHTCYTWGEMQMVFMAYESSRRRVPKQAGNYGKSATNLVYLHPYLTDFHWGLIAQRVKNFGDENCLKLLNDLILQKIHALPYLEDETEGPYIDEGPATVCANYLKDNADGKWLTQHAGEFAHLLKPIDVFKMAKSLVTYYEMNEVEDLSSISEDIQETKPLVLSLLCWSFRSISKQFAACGLKEPKRILHIIDFEKMLQTESENDDENKTEATVAVKTALDEICSLISKDFEYVDESFEVSIEKNLILLNSLSTAYLSKENKSVLFYLTLSLVKNLIKLKPKNADLEKCLDSSCRLLLNFSQDVIVAETLSINEELVWIYRGVRGTSCCQPVMECLCKMSGVTFESVIASDDSIADRMEVVDLQEESISLDVSGYEDQLSEPTVGNISKLNRYLRLAMKEKNQQVKQRILAKACRLVQKYISTDDKDDLLSILPVTKGFMKIFTDVIQNKKFGIRYAMIDLCFELISFAVNVKSTEDELLVEAIELLFSICKVRMPLVLDRIPTFYLCYKNLFIETAKRSTESCRNIQTLVCAAHKLEKLTDVLYKNKKDFTKTSISAVGDFIEVFAHHSIEEDVKMHLKNVVSCWIGISDVYVQHFLSSALSPVAQKLFQQLYSDYNKYYKFTGKV